MQTFTAYLRERGLSTRTVRQYRQIAVAWLESDLEPGAYCARGDPSPQTHNQRAAAIRHYYGYCGEEPPEIVSWRLNREPPRYISVDDLLRWLAEIHKFSLREYAAACLMYSAGLRVGELVSLELEDLDLDRRVVRVQGKGGKIRQVPFDAEVAAPALRMYLDWIRPRLERQDSPARVFLADHGGEYQSRMLTRTVRAGAAAAGLPELERPNHQMRHAFATHILEGGLSVNQLMALLGHANLSTTQMYVSVNMTDVRKNYDKTHPLAKGRKPKVGLELLEEKSV